MHVVIQIQSFRRKPKNLKSQFSRINKRRSKDIKHFTTAKGKAVIISNIDNIIFYKLTKIVGAF